ncbi:hypothetical protein ACFFJB_01745 [Camelimonas abortus]|uniref:General stress protein 17M-like domain-containing protein n=1 Tax=Camelimonas abortus TaxID=1017184 RepID=A0ABV7LF35_9HYPH
MRTVSAMYDDHAAALAAADRLEALGVERDDISIVASNADGWRDGDGEESHAGEGAAAGAGVGAALGGAGGLLAGLGLMAIPGVGPVVAAGWLAATAAGAAAGAATGAAAGGIVGAMTSAGVPEHEANLYAEGVRRGGSLVSARVDDALAGRAQETLHAGNAVDINARETAWREQGWERFDPDSPGYTPEQVREERSRYL